jgi:pumilio RNA-binding family
MTTMPTYCFSQAEGCVNHVSSWSDAGGGTSSTNERQLAENISPVYVKPMVVPCFGLPVVQPIMVYAWLAAEGRTEPLQGITAATNGYADGVYAPAQEQRKTRAGGRRRGGRRRRNRPCTQSTTEEGEATPSEADDDATTDERTKVAQGSASVDLEINENDILGNLAAPTASPAHCALATSKLKSACIDERHAMVKTLLPLATKLALADQHGSRLVQEMVVCAGPFQVDLLLLLAARTEELYVSPHGNHVMTKMIEAVPSATLGPVIARLTGQVKAVAKHRYGCRILERLIEHCSQEQLYPIQEEVVADAEALCRHPYGNFVVQHSLEHGSTVLRQRILHQMLPVTPLLAVHRTASHSVQRALDHCAETDRFAIINAMIHGTPPHSFPEIACSRYGSFVVEQLASPPFEKYPEVRQRLLECHVLLAASQFGRRVAEKFEIPLLESQPGADP